MSLTLTQVAGTRIVVSNKKEVVYDVVFDSSYPTGGEPLVAADVKLKKIDQVIPHGAFRATSGGATAIIVSFDYTNNKLFAYRQKDPGDAGGADVALPEVGNTITLAAFSGRITVVGY